MELMIQFFLSLTFSLYHVLNRFSISRCANLTRFCVFNAWRQEMGVSEPTKFLSEVSKAGDWVRVGRVRDEEPQKKLDSLGAFLKSRVFNGNSNISGIFTPKLGEMIPFWLIFFKWGWFNHQPDQVCFGFLEDDLTHNPYCSRVLASFLIDIACVRLREDGFGLQICTPRETGCGCVPNLGSLKSSTGTNTTYPTKINIRWHKSIISGNLDVWFGHLPNFERFAMLLFSADPVLTAASLKTWLHWIRETTFGSKIGGLKLKIVSNNIWRSCGFAPLRPTKQTCGNTFLWWRIMWAIF